MSSFRFSSNIFGLKSRDEFTAMCRRAESYGYDTIFAVDHLGHAAPFQAVVAAAAATERLRVGTLVVNVPFWNPAFARPRDRHRGHPDRRPSRGRPWGRAHEVGVRRGPHPLAVA